jgi:hypothetical protein
MRNGNECGNKPEHVVGGLPYKFTGVGLAGAWRATANMPTSVSQDYKSPYP